MIKLIIGNKGSGKTKKLIDLVNTCVEKSDGNVVCIEKEPKLTYDVSSKARLLETDTYRVSGCKAFLRLFGRYLRRQLRRDGYFDRRHL